MTPPLGAWLPAASAGDIHSDHLDPYDVCLAVGDAVTYEAEWDGREGGLGGGKDKVYRYASRL